MKQVLFIHGAGGGAYEADAALAKSLRQKLGTDYEVTYPAMVNESDPVYSEWKQQIEALLTKSKSQAILIGHSIGGSVLLKFLSEVNLGDRIAGVCIMAAPFWGGAGWRYEGYEELEVSEALTEKLPSQTPVFLYHCRDDDIVPYEHLSLYSELLPQAIVRSQATGGHQFENDLSLVAKDIKNLHSLDSI